MIRDQKIPPQYHQISSNKTSQGNLQKNTTLTGGYFFKDRLGGFIWGNSVVVWLYLSAADITTFFRKKNKPTIASYPLPSPPTPSIPLHLRRARDIGISKAPRGWGRVAQVGQGWPRIA